LGDEFQPAMRTGWLAYICKTYPDGAAAAVDEIGEGTLVLFLTMIESGMLLACMLTYPLWWVADWPVFYNEYTPKSQFRNLK
jgi:hypothetical protein